MSGILSRRRRGRSAALSLSAMGLLAACGGSTQSTPPNPAGSAGEAHSVGGSSGSGSVAGSSNGGSAAGTGGKMPDFPGGAPNTPLSCSAPYAGPTGGPRVDGPIDLGACAGIADDVVLARYKDYAARVPRGLYYEPSESITFWGEPCSKSVEDTISRGPQDGMGTFVTAYSTDWFYEAVYCFDNTVRRTQRNLRCDYFDGTKLATPTAANAAFLASLLWWSDKANQGGVAILGHAVAIGDATDVIELCTVEVTGGDFGTCDEVRLVSTRHRLVVDGTFKPGSPEVIRSLKGECH